MTLEDYLFQDAQLYPDKTAVVCGGKTVTYARLWQLVRERAQAIKQPRNTLVFFLATQDIDFLVTYFAIHLAGCVAAPLEAGTPVGRLEELRQQSLEAPPLPDGIADVLYTTGTTGKSKGVIISHRTIVANGENLIAGQGFSHELLFIVNGPLNHIGSLSKLYPVVMLGATVCILEGMKHLDAFFLALDYPYKKMATFLVPASVRMLTQLCSERLAQYAHKLDFIESGGAPLPHADMVALCQLLPDTRLYNTYASTETGIISTYNYNDGRCLVGCLGRTMPHSRIMITPEGHISCQGDTLMSGYYGDPELTSQVLHDQTVFMSDFGHLDEEGMLFIEGRADDVINIGGYKIAPQEVEDAVLTFQEISDCICVSTPHPITGLALKLYVVMKEGCLFDKKKLARYLKTKLEVYKIPQLYEQTESIRRTYNGKLDRKAYAGQESQTSRSSRT